MADDRYSAPSGEPGGTPQSMHPNAEPHANAPQPGIQPAASQGGASAPQELIYDPLTESYMTVAEYQQRNQGDRQWQQSAPQQPYQHQYGQQPYNQANAQAPQGYDQRSQQYPPAQPNQGWQTQGQAYDAGANGWQQNGQPYPPQGQPQQWGNQQQWQGQAPQWGAEQPAAQQSPQQPQYQQPAPQAPQPAPQAAQPPAQPASQPEPQPKTAPEPEPQPAADPTPAAKPASKTPLIIALSVLVVAAVGFAVWFFVLRAPSNTNPHPDDDWYDQGTTLTTYEGMTDEEIAAMLDAIIAENEMNCTCNSTIYVDHETGVAAVGVINIEANHFDQRFTLTLDDGTILYESGGIAPGNTVEAVELTHLPDVGEYSGTMTFQGYDAETHRANGGTAGFRVTVVVMD